MKWHYSWEWDISFIKIPFYASDWRIYSEHIYLETREYIIFKSPYIELSFKDATEIECTEKAGSKRKLSKLSEVDFSCSGEDVWKKLCEKRYRNETYSLFKKTKKYKRKKENMRNYISNRVTVSKQSDRITKFKNGVSNGPLCCNM